MRFVGILFCACTYAAVPSETILWKSTLVRFAAPSCLEKLLVTADVELHAAIGGA